MGTDEIKNKEDIVESLSDARVQACQLLLEMAAKNNLSGMK